MRMAADYAGEIGFNGRLLIEPKPKEPTTHQYDFDVAAILGFLRKYGLIDTLRRHSFKLDDMFLGFIAGMDTYARGLKTAYALRQSGEIEEFIRNRSRNWKIIEFKRS